MSIRTTFKDKKRIIIKVGSSTITHEETGGLNLFKIEKLVRILTDLRNSGHDVLLVTSGAIAVGRKTIGLNHRPDTIAEKQACAAIGQASLMTIYQKLFSEYGQTCAQVLLTKFTFENETSNQNACNTIKELFSLGVIPVVNENDTIATEEIVIGDNDTLSAMVTKIAKGDLLILLSDIDGLYTDDPHKNKDAKFIDIVNKIDDEILSLGKDTSGNVGTGGMHTKLTAAGIALDAGADMVIANGKSVENIEKIINGENIGTVFTKYTNK